MFLTLFAAFALQPDTAMLRHLFEEALAKRQQEFGADHARTAQAARDLGLFLKNQSDDPGAKEALAEAMRIDEKVFGAGALQTLADTAELAAISAPEPAQALWLRAAQSPDAAVAARASAALGDLRDSAGDRAGAADLYRLALAKEETASGKDGPRVAVRLNALALAVPPRESIPLLQRALAINRRAWGERHPETATTEANLVGPLLSLGRVNEAVAAGTRALAAFENTLGNEHPRTAAAASNLADAFRMKGDRTQAEKLYRRALAIDQIAYGPRHAETLNDARNLAEFLREIGRVKDAGEVERQFAINAGPR